MTRLTHAEQKDLFGNLVNVSVRAASVAGLMAGCGFGIVWAAASDCITGAPFFMLIAGIACAVFGFLTGYVSGLVVGTESCGWLTPLHSKRDFGWITTSQCFVVTLTGVFLFKRLMGLSFGGNSGWQSIFFCLILGSAVWLWTSRRLATWYAEYYDERMAAAALSDGPPMAL